MACVPHTFSPPHDNVSPEKKQILLLVYGFLLFPGWRTKCNKIKKILSTDIKEDKLSEEMARFNEFLCSLTIFHNLK